MGWDLRGVGYKFLIYAEFTCMYACVECTCIITGGWECFMFLCSGNGDGFILVLWGVAVSELCMCDRSICKCLR